jgi:hypothetical protein
LKQSWIIHRHGTIDTFFSQPFSRQDERTGVHPRPAQTPRDAAPRAAPRARVHAARAATHGSGLWTDSARGSRDEGLGEKSVVQQSLVAICLAAHCPALRLDRPTRLPQCLTVESSHADAAARQSKTALQVLAPREPHGLMPKPRTIAVFAALNRSWLPSTECAQLGHQGLRFASVAVHMPGRKPGTISICHGAPAFHHPATNVYKMYQGRRLRPPQLISAACPEPRRFAREHGAQPARVIAVLIAKQLPAQLGHDNDYRATPPVLCQRKAPCIFAIRVRHRAPCVQHEQPSRRRRIRGGRGPQAFANTHFRQRA